MKDISCKRCNGNGETFQTGYQSRYIECPHCNGTGIGECRIDCYLCSEAHEQYVEKFTLDHCK